MCLVYGVPPIRWISSMNKISLSARLVRIAAKSPVFSMAGPEVILILPPISAAIIWAKVVLPRPGQPCKSTCSIGSALFLLQTKKLSLRKVLLFYIRKRTTILAIARICVCLTKSEPFLNGTDAAPAARQKTNPLGRGGQKKGCGENECPPRPRLENSPWKIPDTYMELYLHIEE